MKGSSELRVSVSGPSWKRLKKDAHDIITGRFGFRKDRFGTYVGNRLTVDATLTLVNILYNVEASLCDGTELRELIISGGFNVHIQLRRPVKK